MATIDTSDVIQRNIYTGAIYQFSDIAKSYLFMVHFQFPQSVMLSEEALFGKYGAAGLTLKARSVNIPQKSTETLTTEFMGSKRLYPGKTKVDGTVDIKFDEFQDMQLAKSFYNWQNLIFNHGVPGHYADNDMGNGAGAYSDFLTDYAATLLIDLYDGANKRKLPYSYKVYDAFPLNNGSITLDAEQNGKIAPTIQFSYGTWEQIDNKTLSNFIK